jgi:hypothetical protein
MSVAPPPIPAELPAPDAAPEEPPAPLADALPPDAAPPDDLGPGEIPPPPDPTKPPPPAADPAAVEAMVAVLGIEPFADKTLKRVHLYHLDRAAKLGAEIDRELYKFIGSDEPLPVAKLQPFDFQKVVEDLKTPPLPKHTAAIMGAFGEHADTAFAANEIADKIQTYLLGKVPKRTHEGIQGPVDEMPAHSDVARFRRLWSVACDPVGVIMEAVGEYALSRDMVRAFADMYPLTYARCQQGIETQLARKSGVEPKFRLSIRKEQILRILKQQEDVTSRALGVALQAMFKKDMVSLAPKPPKPKTPGSASTESTETDRIMAGD